MRLKKGIFEVIFGNIYFMTLSIDDHSYKTACLSFQIVSFCYLES